MVRARNSLSTGAALRPLLGKYAIDYNSVAVVFTGTLEVVRNSVSIGNIGQRSLTTMSHNQYNERLHGAKKEALPVRDPMAATVNLVIEQNLQFHQHGDISYCELPNEMDRLKHAQKMHLKRMRLLGIVLCVLMVDGHSLWKEDLKYGENVDVTGPIVCGHDGYLRGDTCVCKPYFTLTSCTRRVCQNDGVLRNPTMDLGCKCPPGFLGTSCEAVQCVAGKSHSFFEEHQKQSIYVLVTYNAFMNATIAKNDDDPILAVCQSVVKNDITNAFLSTDVDMATNVPIDPQIGAEDCVAKAKSSCVPASSCNPNTLTVESVNMVIDQSQANSQVIIVTNSALEAPVTTNDTIKKAISRRIKVHVIAFAPEAPITDNDYNALPGYAALRAVVDATFGFYITPYSGSTNKQMSSSTASEAISDIFDMMSNNFDAVAVRPTKTVQEFRFNVGTEKFYIAYRSLGVEPESITFDAKPSSLKLERDTGFWKLMSAQEDSGNTQFSLRYTGSGPDFSVQMLSSTLLRTFAGVTSSGAIDISSPYLAAGTLGTLVARVNNENVAVAGGLTVNVSDGISFSPNTVTRPSCQFSLGLGTIVCQDAGAGVLSLQSSDGKGSAVPFMCVNEGLQEEISTTTHVHRENSRSLSENVGEKCTSNLGHSSLIEYTPLKRTFAFIARNTRDNDTDKSTVDNLIVYPNNLLDYLVSYLSKNPGYYTSFLANIFSAENAKATFQTLDISSYVTYVMNTIHGSTDNDSNDSYDYGSALRNALYTFESYSDIFVVVDSMTDALVVDSSLLETMSQRRVKIYFIMVETYSEFPDGTYKEFSSLAARTGGAAFRLSDYDAVRKFLDVYFNEIIGGDLVSYKPYYHLSADGLYVETYSFNAQSDLEYTMLTVNPDGSSKVVSADVFSSDNDISIPLCSPQTIGRDLTFVSFQCASFSVETFQARVYFSSSDETTTSGSVFIFEKNSSSTTSIAFSPTVNGNAISGTPSWFEKRDESHGIDVHTTHDEREEEKMRSV